MFSLFMLCVQGFLWLARGLLKALSWIALAACAALLREMEFDADRMEARATGSESFAVTSHKLAVLHAARQAGESLQGRWWQSSRLADDVPGLIAAMDQRVRARPEVLEQITRASIEEKTGRFDTHPSLSDRLDNVARAAEPGAFQVDVPAAELFTDLDVLCRATTLASYEAGLGMAFRSARVLPLSELMYEIDGNSASEAVLARFAQGCPLVDCRVSITPAEIAAPEADVPHDEAVQTLEAARQQVLDLAPAAAEAGQNLEQLRKRHDELGLALAMIQSGCSVDPTPLGIPAADLNSAQDARRRSTIALREAEQQLTPISQALSARLASALRLRHRPDLREALERLQVESRSPWILARSDDLATALDRVVSLRPDLDRLAAKLALIRGVCERAESEALPPQLTGKTLDASKEVRELVKSITTTLGEVPYPFPTSSSGANLGSGPATIGTYLGSATISSDVAEVHNRGAGMLLQVRNLEGRILGTLALATEQIETALGLPLLPDAPSDPETAPAPDADAQVA
jgi:hypothetical protein